MRLTILIFVVIISLFIACKSKNRISYTKTHNTTIRIPENTLIDLIITGIDSTSVDLYEIVRFYYQKPTNIGIILKEMSSPENYIVDQVYKLKLCDIGIYGVLYSERYTIYRGNVPLIYGKQEGLREKIDTVYFKGDFMMNGVIISDNKVILDFGDNAIEPVFEVCKE